MNDEKQLAESAENEPAAADAAGVADGAALLEALTKERDQLAKEKAEVYDQFLRRTAEFENLRRRSQRERAEILEFAGMEVVRDLLPILDDFERALKNPSSDKEYQKGMELIYGRLFSALHKAGLEPMDSEGRPFDPHVHHAVETVETARWRTTRSSRNCSEGTISKGGCCERRW